MNDNEARARVGEAQQTMEAKEARRNAFSRALEGLSDYEAENVMHAFIDRVLYVLPREVRHAAIEASTHDRAGELWEMVKNAGGGEGEGERMGYPPAGPDATRVSLRDYHLACARLCVLGALHQRTAGLLAEDALGEGRGEVVKTVARLCQRAAGHSGAADACYRSDRILEAAEQYWIESIGDACETAWHYWRVLDD